MRTIGEILRVIIYQGLEDSLRTGLAGVFAVTGRGRFEDRPRCKEDSEVFD